MIRSSMYQATPANARISSPKQSGDSTYESAHVVYSSSFNPRPAPCLRRHTKEAILSFLSPPLQCVPTIHTPEIPIIIQFIQSNPRKRKKGDPRIPLRHPAQAPPHSHRRSPSSASATHPSWLSQSQHQSMPTSKSPSIPHPQNQGTTY